MAGSGSGNILFDTGSVAITLDALPDPDSAIVYSYITQNDDEVTLQTGTVAVDNIAFRHTVEKPGIKPGSLTITYLASGETQTLTDQGNGLLSGDGSLSAEGSGAIHYASGELSFVLDYLPDDGSEIDIQYEEGTAAGGQVAVTVDGQGVMSGTIAGAPLLPGSIQLQFLVERQSNVPNANGGELTTYSSTLPVQKTLSDDVAGGWREGRAISFDKHQSCCIFKKLALKTEFFEKYRKLGLFWYFCRENPRIQDASSRPAQNKELSY